MYTLGIETSCDETSVAIVENGTRIVSCEVSSSLDLHKKYGGIVPEIASRMQMETIVPVASLALKKAAVRLGKIGLVGFTEHPGLLGSLLVGISFARALSLSRNIPLMEINHLYAHIYAALLGRRAIRFPFIALIVSGGHTSLFFARDFNRMKILGRTCDDACGEAFDKVAKILGLDYPGGPQIERLAKNGDAKKIKFGCSDTLLPLDFSFSGIKTAVLYLAKNRQLTIKDKQDIAASFQKTVIDVLIKKSLLACRQYKINRLVIAGGVCANDTLRQKSIIAARDEKIEVYFPAKSLCMDNAAMVAGLSWYLYAKKRRRS